MRIFGEMFFLSFLRAGPSVLLEGIMTGRCSAFTEWKPEATASDYGIVLNTSALFSPDKPGFVVQVMPPPKVFISEGLCHRPQVLLSLFSTT